MARAVATRFSVLLVLPLVFLGVASAAWAEEGGELRGQALALNDITGENPIEGQVRILVGEPEKAKKLLSAAAEMAKEKDQPFNYNAAYILARTALLVQEPQKAQIFYRVCAEQSARLGSSRKLLYAYFGMLNVIDLLYIDKKFTESAKLSQELLETLERQARFRPEFKQEVLRRLIRAMAKEGRTDEANRMVDNLLKARGSNWRNWELKARLQVDAGKFEVAVKTYEEVLQRILKDKELNKEDRLDAVAAVRYTLSQVYMEFDQVDKACEQLQTLLKDYPDNPGYNNDLGYIWADHDQNLDEAERLIRKALAEDRKLRKKEDPSARGEDDKDNPAYLDSMAWVLFKKKKYQEAKPYLLQAIKEKEGNHIEILDHLGDIHLALGERTEAIEVWKKAIKAAGPGRREQAKKAVVEKKLKKFENLATATQAKPEG